MNLIPLYLPTYSRLTPSYYLIIPLKFRVLLYQHLKRVGSSIERGGIVVAANLKRFQISLLLVLLHYYTTSVKLTHHVNRISEFETWKVPHTHDVNLHEIVATAATSNLAHG